MGKLDPKSTGGEGFDFEDKVGAFFLSFLLVGTSPFPTLKLGKLISLKFQGKVDGWKIDDIILEFDLDGLKNNIAFSIKSNSYFTANTMPQEFVLCLWDQFCNVEKNPFRSNHDYLGIITSGTSTSAKETFRDLNKFSTRHNGTDLSLHLNHPNFTNAAVRSMYDSFKRPEQILGREALDQAEVISRLLHFDINLDDPTSAQLRESFGNFALALTQGDPNLLWIKLQNMVKTTRSVAGMIDFPTLLKELSDNFGIKGQHHLESDSQKLKVIFETETAKIKSTIGNNLIIERTSSSTDRFEKQKINAYIGESGSGKSVQLKQWAEKSGKPVVWLPYTVFKAKTLNEINTLLGIENDIFEILKYGPTEQLVILDAADRLSSAEELDLLKSFLIRFQRTAEQRHIFVIASQDQIWTNIVGSLSTQEVSFNVVEASRFNDDDLNTVAKAIPTITQILAIRQTREVLRNPKYLDLAVQMADSSSLDLTKAVNEPSLIRGFWNLISDNPVNQKKLYLTKLAREQADAGNFITPLDSLTETELSYSEQLAHQGIIKIQGNTLRFAHDLYGDWIRQRDLLSDRNLTNSEMVKRKNNIYWHQAIRLTSLEILESEGFDEWRKIVTLFNSKGETVIVDTFLDIAITPLNQGSILESIKELLLADGSKFFHRFLERFINYATTPNPEIMSRREEFQMAELEAAQINRVPLYGYWPSLLLFLSKNFDPNTGGISQVSKIASTWLQFTPEIFPFRKEAANLAYRAAHWIYEFKQQPHSYIQDEIDKKSYEALLAAYPEIPNKVENLCLKLIGLQFSEPIVLSKPKENLRVIDSKFTQMETFGRRKIEKKPFPNGPLYKKDKQFQDVCIENKNLLPIILSNPHLASKLLLAAIIDTPREYEDTFDRGLNNLYGTVYTQKFYPPFYTKGPFLIFFRNKPDQAFETLIQLVNLVTDEWENNQKKMGWDILEVELELGTKKNWRGDPQVTFWYMDLARCPDVVVAFLMACEKWFYEKIEAKEDIVIWIDQITENSNSLAFIGLLISVAKKSPNLFIDRFRSLLTCPELIAWDLQSIIQNSSGFVSMIPWGSQGQLMRNLASDWFSMNHRKTTLEEWALYFLLNTSDLHDQFRKAREQWAEMLKTIDDSQLESLFYKFDNSNYKIVTTLDGLQSWQYTIPDSFYEKHKLRFTKNDIQLELFSLPMKINKLLSEKSFSPAEYNAITNTVKSITTNIKDSEIDEAMLTTPNDCNIMMDGLTLIADARKIVSFEKDFIDATKQRISDAIQNLWSEKGIAGHPSDQSDHKYDTAIARVLGELSSKSDGDIWLRKQIGHLIIGPRYIIATSFFKSAADWKVHSGFILHCLNLIFDYLKLRTAWHETEFSMRYSKKAESNLIKAFLCKNSFIRNRVFNQFSSDDRFEMYSRELSLIIDNFILGSNKNSWPLWKFELSKYKFTDGLNIKEDSDRIELEHFTHSVSGLPSMEVWDETLKNGWINFCTDGVDQISERRREALERGEKNGSPYSQDYWLLEKFADSYFWFTDVKLDKSLKDCLDLGAENSSWIDSFGHTFCRNAFMHPDRSSMFIPKLNKIFEMALTIDKFQSNKKSWQIDDIWCSIVGLDDFSLRYLQTVNTNLISELFPFYERLMTIRSGSTKCLRQLITLLCMPEAKEIRMKGLSIVASELKNINYKDYNHEQNISTYSHFLTTLWQDDQKALKDNAAALMDFHQILNGLIFVQNSSGLLLAAKINSSR